MSEPARAGVRGDYDTPCGWCGHGASYHASNGCWYEYWMEGPICKCDAFKPRAEAPTEAGS